MNCEVRIATKSQKKQGVGDSFMHYSGSSRVQLINDGDAEKRHSPRRRCQALEDVVRSGILKFHAQPPLQTEGQEVWQ